MFRRWMRDGDVLAFRIFLFARLFSMVLFMLIMSSVSLALDMSQIFGTGPGPLESWNGDADNRTRTMAIDGNA